MYRRFVLLAVCLAALTLRAAPAGSQTVVKPELRGEYLGLTQLGDVEPEPNEILGTFRLLLAS